MPLPGPPTVIGPITPITPEVCVIGVIDGAEVSIVGTRRGKKPQLLGRGTAGANGEWWFALTKAPTVGQAVTARQKTTDGDSDPSRVPVVVIDTPLPPSSPGIRSGLNTCMAGIYLDGLTPGATVTALNGGKKVIDALATRTKQHFDIDPAATITHESVLEIYQQAPLGGQNKSDVLTSLPIRSLGLEHLEPPQVALPLEACKSPIVFTAAIPGAIVRIDNDAQSAAWDAPDVSFPGKFPLKMGALFATQEMPRCNLYSQKARYSVDPASPPPKPVIQQELCQDVPSFTASQLKPGGLLYYSRVVTWSGGGTISDPRKVGIASETQTIELPAGWELIDPQGWPVTLEVYQVSCAVRSDSAEVAVAVAGGPFSPPKVIGPVYPCVRALRISGAHPGSYVQAFDEQSNKPISDKKPAPAADFLLDLWFPAIASRSIVVRQSGCNAVGESRTTIEPLPEELPVPKVQPFICPGAHAVRLEQVLPGARVFVLVDGVARTQTDCFTETPTLHLPGKALQEKQEVRAYQCLCFRWSKDGQPVTVTKGNMNVSFSPPGPFPRNAPSQITVSATDADTNRPIDAGEVRLNNKTVGIPNQPFSFTPTVNDPKDVPGEVISEGYNSAYFDIPLKEALWTLALSAAPTDGSQLKIESKTFSDENLQLQVDEVSWEITPDWDPQLKQTTLPVKNTSKSGWLWTTVYLPLPPASGHKVEISLKMKCSAPDGGKLNGQTIFPGAISTGSIEDIPINPTITQSKIDVRWRVKYKWKEGQGVDPDVEIYAGKDVIAYS